MSKVDPFVMRHVSLGDEPTDADIRIGVEVLDDGGIVAYPTDTLYGLAVDPTRDSAVKRLCQLKQRSLDSGLPLIAASLTQVETCLGALPSLGRHLCERFWPGPLTLVFTPENTISSGVCAADGSVAVRVPRCLVACRLAELSGHPITATSANFAGVKPPSTAEGVASQLVGKIDLVLGTKGSLGGSASTIVDVRGSEPLLIRNGAIAWNCVLQSTG
ncbi:MAG: threonylcarbamoyl-AMP synthase [Acidobacteria bacterium]|nr:threonylcarbamoyl-AMP synthase [Acidobacteriota bacterium]